MAYAKEAYHSNGNDNRPPFLNLSPWRRFFGERGKRVEKSPLGQIYTEAAGFYRALHLSEGRRRSIIDFDLTPYPSPEFAIAQRLITAGPTRGEKMQPIEILGELTSRMESIVVSPAERQNYEFLQAKLKASLAYVRRLTGELSDPSVYIQETMGVIPEKIPEGTLLAQKQKVAALFKELGGGNYDEESLQSYYEKRLIPPEEMARRIEIYGQEALSLVGNFINRKVQVDHETEIVDKDAYWFNWVNGTVKKFCLQINKHKRHRNKFTDGKAQAMAYHEIAAHLGMMQQRAELIRKGELHEVFGLTTVHDPEQVPLEGIAQTLNYFVPELNHSLSPEGKFEIELNGLRQMVYNNIHLLVISPDFISSPEQLEGIIKYVQSYYPLEPKENILKEVSERWKDPKLQAYRYSYGVGFLRHREFAHGLNRDGKREFLKRLWGRPFTPAQEENLYLNLQDNPRYRAAA